MNYLLYLDITIFTMITYLVTEMLLKTLYLCIIES